MRAKLLPSGRTTEQFGPFSDGWGHVMEYAALFGCIPSDDPRITGVVWFDDNGTPVSAQTLLSPFVSTGGDLGIEVPWMLL